ncbi:class I adenylate-forming enzyme family protein [Streptomyces spinosirectus]
MLDLTPDGPVDALLAATAAAHPGRLAVAGEGELTFAELDAWATAYAHALRPLLSRPAARVAVSSFPDPAFMAGYYGALRAGAVAVPVNPLLPEAALERVLEQSGAEVALLTPAVYGGVLPLLGRLPALAHVFQLWAEDGDPQTVLVPRDTARRDAGDEGAAARSIAPDDTAVVMFTSGTTGPSKGVAVSHRAIRANAWQFGQAHGIGAGSVVLCHLPIVSPMHMNAAVRVGACQVLCPAPDIATSARLANEHGATHYYSLPVRLARLASAPELAGVTLEKVTMIAAGNQTLAPRVITALADRFGVPVFQGYGLTEAAHLAHTDGPVDPRPGSAGPAVPGGRSRIVDIATRAVLGPGEPGELEISGPQLMTGYINRPDLRPFDEDGWFSTGDVGSLDEDGCLYVLDRLVDVFHHDGELVSPSRLERALEEHPAVAEAAVADQADGDRGRTPVAYLALAPGSRQDCAEALAAVNDRLRPYERIRHAVAVAEVRRSPTNGKVDRKALRAELAERPVMALLTPEGQRTAPRAPSEGARR